MKTKLLFFAAIAMLMLAGCSKERETPTPPPTPDEEQYDIYVSGSLYNRKTEINSYLKKGQWYDLALPDDDDFYYTTAIALDEGKVYVTLNHGGGDKATGYCIDGVWHANQMPDGATSTYPSSSIGFLDGSVYMSGYYVTEARELVACYWKDGVCHPLAIPGYSGRTSAEGLAVSGGSVYIAGNGGENCGYWKDGVWNPLPLPDGRMFYYITDIACSEGSVYVLGNTSIDQICLWVDGVAQILSAPGGVNCFGNKIAVAEGSVYIAGSYRDNGEYACYWKDGVFHKLDAPGTSSTEDIAVADGAVFIAGNYYEFSEHESVGCYWKDGVRVDIPTPEGMKSHVSGMAVAKKQ